MHTMHDDVMHHNDIHSFFQVKSARMKFQIFNSCHKSLSPPTWATTFVSFALPKYLNLASMTGYRRVCGTSLWWGYLLVRKVERKTKFPKQTALKLCCMSFWNVGTLGTWVRVSGTARGFPKIYRKRLIGNSNII